MMCQLNFILDQEECFTPILKLYINWEQAWLGVSVLGNLVSGWLGCVCKQKMRFCVDFSFCWINLEASWFSLEQNSCCSCRQAFIYCCRLHQVWKRTEKTALIWVLGGSVGMLRTTKEVWREVGIIRTLGEIGIFRRGVVGIIIIIDLPFKIKTWSVE